MDRMFRSHPSTDILFMGVSGAQAGSGPHVNLPGLSVIHKNTYFFSVVVVRLIGGVFRSSCTQVP